MKRRTVVVVVAAGVTAGLLLPLHPFTTWQQRANATYSVPNTRPVVRSIRGTGVVQEDDPKWNCFTMGNKTCGTIKHVTQTLGDVLAEGADKDYNWESCVVDDVSIMCPDGNVVTVSKD